MYVTAEGRNLPSAVFYPVNSPYAECEFTKENKLTIIVVKLSYDGSKTKEEWKIRMEKTLGR